jgi:arylsulfatase
VTNIDVQEVNNETTIPAIMTGRYAIRGGNGAVPVGESLSGLMQWEVTMTDQGFDESYGIPNSTEEPVYSLPARMWRPGK